MWAFEIIVNYEVIWNTYFQTKDLSPNLSIFKQIIIGEYARFYIIGHRVRFVFYVQYRKKNKKKTSKN